MRLKLSANRVLRTVQKRSRCSRVLLSKVHALVSVHGAVIEGDDVEFVRGVGAVVEGDDVEFVRGVGAVVEGTALRVNQSINMS